MQRLPGAVIGDNVPAPKRRFDLPGGAKRMVMPSQGVECTIVNGEVTYQGGEQVGGSAGKVLRS